jgi:hypothetical protein
MQEAFEENIVEVFKTNVKSTDVAQFAIQKLKELLPYAKINFDLDDCDHILRIEALRSEIEVDAIVHYAKKMNIQIEVLS